MADDSKKFVLYEYLSYFWKKKLLFLIIPIITTLLLVGAVFVLKDEQSYTGKVLFFTGSIKKTDLTHPNNIKANYCEDLKTDSVNVFVSEKSQVKFVLKDDSEEIIQHDIERISNSFIEDLQKQYDIQKEETIKYAESLEKRAEVLEKAIENYKNKINETPEQLLIDLIIESENELTKINERTYKLRSDLAFFEEPKLLYQEVNKTDNHLMEIIAIGIMIGLVFSVALLSLLKYLEEARLGLKK